MEHSLVGHGAQRLRLSLCWKWWFTALGLHLAILSSQRICSWYPVHQGPAGRWGGKHFNDFQQINFPAKSVQMGGLSFSNRKVLLKNKYVHSHVFAELPLGTSKLPNYRVGRKNVKNKVQTLVLSDKLIELQILEIMSISQMETQRPGGELTFLRPHSWSHRTPERQRWQI